MTQPTSPESMRASRSIFFKLVFGTQAEGYVCIAYKSRGAGFKEEFFHYPEELDKLLATVDKNHKNTNVYFCPQLLEDPRYRRESDGKGPRVKENISTCTAAWADLEECGPELLLVPPSITVESSAGRYQALWVFEAAVDPEVAEQVSKNIAYHHVPDGADSGGWDLTQLLRVPYTYNMKRALPELVVIRAVTRRRYKVDDFSTYKESRINRSKHDPMPEILPGETALEIMQRYRKSINPIVFSLYDVEPQVTSEEGGWSKPLWQLQMLCFEAGMSREEVFVIARDAACNKYRRDNKHPRLLWEEVCRAYATTVEKINQIVPDEEEKRPLLSAAELAQIEGYETFVERYINWASSLGDAAQQYHQAGGFMILSALLAGAIRLPTSFGTVMPNLWFMLLADTTLTRKSTAMDIAMDIIEEVEPEAVVATDGSLEGLMQSLEVRPGKPSVFLRDEVAGLIEQITRKDYMAGMAEALTKLYDGKTMKRVLKRETVTVKEPCFLFFAGGIKTRVQSMLTLDHVSSGFVPRFLFLTAESDVGRLQPLGPPTLLNQSVRETLVDEARAIQDKYVLTQDVILKGQVVGINNLRTNGVLTEEAWSRYNQLEATLLYAGVNSDQPDIMTPVYDRLSKSILKAALLIAASQMRGGDEVVVELEDLLLAIKYGDGWRDYAHEVINGIGRNANEVLLERVLKSIRRHPGVARSRLMQWYHLSAREADILFSTLEQRGLISASRIGKTWAYEAIGRIPTSVPQD
jgi:hypothetical protein